MTCKMTKKQEKSLVSKGKLLFPLARVRGTTKAQGICGKCTNVRLNWGVEIT